MVEYSDEGGGGGEEAPSVPKREHPEGPSTRAPRDPVRPRVYVAGRVLDAPEHHRARSSPEPPNVPFREQIIEDSVNEPEAIAASDVDEGAPASNPRADVFLETWLSDNPIERDATTAVARYFKMNSHFEAARLCIRLGAFLTRQLQRNGKIIIENGKGARFELRFVSEPEEG